ncbi:MAG TPA: phenylacetate--CoA ligase family protein [Aldersonia sp.]
MGNWIGGTYTYAALTALANRGHRISVIAPGIDVDSILENISRLGRHYDRIVLTGYPPFVKDVLDGAASALLRHDLRVLLAGETISERWRDHVLARIGKPERPQDTCLIYGTADAGMIGHETPTTIAVRRLADRDPSLRGAVLGGTGALPTFVEYDPDLRYVETEHSPPQDPAERLLFTVDSAIPLIRYRINDVGSVLTASDLTTILREHGHDLPVDTSTEATAFLALRHRTDIAATFYGLGIYPDNVKAGLEDGRIAGAVTGKFVMSAHTDRRWDQSLALRVELRDGVRGDEVSERLVCAAVVDGLERTNSEYRRLHQSIGHRAEPRVSLHRFGSDGFRPGIKHAWTEAPA